MSALDLRALIPAVIAHLQRNRQSGRTSSAIRSVDGKSGLLVVASESERPAVLNAARRFLVPARVSTEQIVVLGALASRLCGERRNVVLDHTAVEALLTAMAQELAEADALLVSLGEGDIIRSDTEFFDKMNNLWARADTSWLRSTVGHPYQIISYPPARHRRVPLQ